MNPLQKIIVETLPPGTLNQPALLLIFVILMILFLVFCANVIKYSNKLFNYLVRKGHGDTALALMLILVVALMLFGKK